MTEAQAQKIEVEIANLLAQTAKLNAEISKINRETFWYPIVVAAGLIGATATIVKLLF